MSKRPRVTVRGHRNTAKPPALTGTKLRHALGRFAEELALAVGAAVHERMREGKWHSSRDERFRYFRTWSKYRYGSSRARTRVGSRLRKEGAGRLDDPDYQLAQPPDVRDTVQMLQFHFLAKKLRDNAQVYGDAHVVGPRARLAEVGSAPISEIAGVFDVSSALAKIREIQARFAVANRDDPQNARERMRQDALDFLNGSYDHNRFFQETPIGQKYLRSAELAALRHSRNERLLDADGGFYDTHPLDERERGLLDKKRQWYGNLRKDILDSKRKPPTLLPLGQMAWGYETGELARAWRDAREQLTLNGDRFKVVIAASEKRDGRNPSALMLTEYLKRNIRKQGGSPNLLTPQLARREARAALRAVQAEWARLGIRLRGGASSKGGP